MTSNFEVIFFEFLHFSKKFRKASDFFKKHPIFFNSLQMTQQPPSDILLS